MLIFPQNALKQTTALVDKITLNNLVIEDIDESFVPYLYRENILEKGMGKAYYYKCSSGFTFKRLTLKDSMIDVLSAGSSGFGSFCTMQLSIHNDDGTNVCCWTIDEYKSFIIKTLYYLKEKYGIKVSSEKIGIKSIEINRTFYINGDYEEYHRVFKLIMHRLKYPMRLNAEWSTKTKGELVPTTYISKSTSKNKSRNYQQFKLYNKTNSVEATIELCESIVRAEVTLIGERRIQQSLGTNELSELTDETINSFYSKWIRDFIIIPIRKWKKERNKNLLCMLRDERSLNITKWKINTLRRIEDWEIQHGYPLVLDVEEIFPLLEKLKISNLPRAKKTFRHQASKYETALINNDDEKLEEILHKLTVSEKMIFPSFNNENQKEMLCEVV